MSKRIFTQEQIEKLSKNKNVDRCSERSIAYGKKFKMNAITQHEQGLTSNEIWRQAGFDLDLIGRDQPKECLKRWNRIYRTKGEEWLLCENRGQLGGRSKSLKNLSATDKIKRLEAEAAYLKEENRFLAKLRKKSLN